MRELLAYTEPLRQHAPPALRQRLLLFRGTMGRINCLSTALAKMIRREFIRRHGLPHFSLASIRPSVLERLLSCVGRSCARSSASLTIAASRPLSATSIRARYKPSIERASRLFRARSSGTSRAPLARTSCAKRARASEAHARRPQCRCSDSTAKTLLPASPPALAAGSYAPIFWAASPARTPSFRDDPRTLARLLQAREHLRDAASSVHPARWQALYAPPLHILEHDILPRFNAAELAAAEPHRAALSSLPELR